MTRRRPPNASSKNQTSAAATSGRAASHRSTLLGGCTPEEGQNEQATGSGTEEVPGVDRRGAMTHQRQGDRQTDAEKGNREKNIHPAEPRQLARLPEHLLGMDGETLRQ